MKQVFRKPVTAKKLRRAQAGSSDYDAFVLEAHGGLVAYRACGVDLNPRDMGYLKRHIDSTAHGDKMKSYGMVSTGLVRRCKAPGSLK